MNIKSLIQNPEGRRLELKEKLPSKSDLSKTIIAFANDAGGILLIGIKDSPREVIGIPDEDVFQMEEQISSLIFDTCAPVIIPDISAINIDGKLVIKVQVYRGGNIPYYLKSKGKNNGTYIRVGSSNRLATEEIITELERLKRNISFDSEPIPDIEYDSLDISHLKTTYLEKTGENLDVSGFKKLNLVKSYLEELKGTHALLLLSDDDRKAEYFPYAKIECARFKGTTVDTFIDRKTLDGNLLDQVEQAYKFVLLYIRQSAETEGVYTKTHWQYPVKAIREVIRNAVIHRDYSLTGKDIKIAIYDDMVEITSPGKLLPSVDYGEMEARQSEIRNKVIAPFFKHLGLIDQWGNGLKLIADELKNYDNIELKWNETGLQFQVQFIVKNFQNTQKEILVVKEGTGVGGESWNFETDSEVFETGDSPIYQKSVGVEINKKGVESGVELGDSGAESGGGSAMALNIIRLLYLEVLSKSEIAQKLGKKKPTRYLNELVVKMLKEETIERTIPEKPNSRLQKYRLTAKGKRLAEKISK